MSSPAYVGMVWAGNRSNAEGIRNESIRNASGVKGKLCKYKNLALFISIISLVMRTKWTEVVR